MASPVVARTHSARPPRPSIAVEGGTPAEQRFGIVASDALTWKSVRDVHVATPSHASYAESLPSRAAASPVPHAAHASQVLHTVPGVSASPSRARASQPTAAALPDSAPSEASASTIDLPPLPDVVSHGHLLASASALADVLDTLKPSALSNVPAMAQMKSAVQKLRVMLTAIQPRLQESEAPTQPGSLQHLVQQEAKALLQTLGHCRAVAHRIASQRMFRNARSGKSASFQAAELASHMAVLSSAVAAMDSRSEGSVSQPARSASPLVRSPSPLAMASGSLPCGAAPPRPCPVPESVEHSTQLAHTRQLHAALVGIGNQPLDSGAWMQWAAWCLQSYVVAPSTLAGSSPDAAAPAEQPSQASALYVQAMQRLQRAADVPVSEHLRSWRSAKMQRPWYATISAEHVMQALAQNGLVAERAGVLRGLLSAALERRAPAHPRTQGYLAACGFEDVLVRSGVPRESVADAARGSASAHSVLQDAKSALAAERANEVRPNSLFRAALAAAKDADAALLGWLASVACAAAVLPELSLPERQPAVTPADARPDASALHESKQDPPTLLSPMLPAADAASAPRAGSAPSITRSASSQRRSLQAALSTTARQHSVRGRCVSFDEDGDDTEPAQRQGSTINRLVAKSLGGDTPHAVRGTRATPRRGSAESLISPAVHAATWASSPASHAGFPARRADSTDRGRDSAQVDAPPAADFGFASGTSSQPNRQPGAPADKLDLAVLRSQPGAARDDRVQLLKRVLLCARRAAAHAAYYRSIEVLEARHVLPVQPAVTPALLELPGHVGFPYEDQRAAWAWRAVWAAQSAGALAATAAARAQGVASGTDEPGIAQQAQLMAAAGHMLCPAPHVLGKLQAAAGPGVAHSVAQAWMLAVHRPAATGKPAAGPAAQQAALVRACSFRWARLSEQAARVVDQRVRQAVALGMDVSGANPASFASAEAAHLSIVADAQLAAALQSATGEEHVAQALLHQVHRWGEASAAQPLPLRLAAQNGGGSQTSSRRAAAQSASAWRHGLLPLLLVGTYPGKYIAPSVAALQAIGAQALAHRQCAAAAHATPPRAAAPAICPPWLAADTPGAQPSAALHVAADAHVVSIAPGTVRRLQEQASSALAAADVGLLPALDASLPSDTSRPGAAIPLLDALDGVLPPESVLDAAAQRYTSESFQPMLRKALAVPALHASVDVMVSELQAAAPMNSATAMACTRSLLQSAALGLGNGRAAQCLGYMAEQGMGSAVSLGAAALWYGLAWALREPAGANALGTMLLSGKIAPLPDVLYRALQAVHSRGVHSQPGVFTPTEFVLVAAHLAAAYTCAAADAAMADIARGDGSSSPADGRSAGAMAWWKASAGPACGRWWVARAKSVSHSARWWLQAGVADGHARSKTSLARALLTGAWHDEDGSASRAQQLLEQAAQEGDSSALGSLATLWMATTPIAPLAGTPVGWLSGRDRVRMQDAAALLAAAAAHGDSAAALQLAGYMAQQADAVTALQARGTGTQAVLAASFRGREGESALATAQAWRLQLAQAGASQQELAREAVGWLLVAARHAQDADAGGVDSPALHALVQLGHCCYEGKGVLMSQAAAADCYLQAANAGSVAGALALALQLQHGSICVSISAQQRAGPGTTVLVGCALLAAAAGVSRASRRCARAALLAAAVEPGRALNNTPCVALPQVLRVPAACHISSHAERQQSTEWLHDAVRAQDDALDRRAVLWSQGVQDDRLVSPSLAAQTALAALAVARPAAQRGSKPPDSFADALGLVQ